MRGTLRKTAAGWIVLYFVRGKWGIKRQKSTLLHPYEKYSYEPREGEVVEFYLTNHWETGMEEVKKYAVISDFCGWDRIFEYLEEEVHVELPERAKNWLKNKYKSPAPNKGVFIQ